MSALPLIVWDVDDVLNDLTEEWFASHAAEFSGKRFSDLVRNPPHEVLGIEREAFLSSLDDFRREHYRELAPNPETLAFFRAHGTEYRHAVLTAVPRRYAPASAEWVMRHFGDWIRAFEFIPSERADWPLFAYRACKSDGLADFPDAAFYLDDFPAHVSGAAARGVRALLVPQPWNANAGKSRTEILSQIQKLDV